MGEDRGADVPERYVMPVFTVPAANSLNLLSTDCAWPVVVYTLWSSPHILPLLHTPAAVVKKLQGGADLMTPGLAGGPPFPAKATRSALVAVASLEAPTVPVVVGSCEIDVSGLQRVEGVKGRAVQTLHWAGDEVWSWSAAGRPGAAVPQQLDGWSAAPDEDGALATQTDGLRLQSNEEQSDTPELHDDAEGPANTAESQADISQHSGTDEHELSMKGMYVSWSAEGLARWALTGP